MSTVFGMLWPGVLAPDWDALKCYALFRIHQSDSRTPTKDETQELSWQLMRKIALSIGQFKLLPILEASGGADEIANSVVFFLLGKIKKFRLRVPWESLSPDAGSRAMIASLNTSIRRKLVEAIKNTARDRAMRIANPHNVAEVMDGMESPTIVDDGDLHRLVDHMTDEETIDRICMRVPGDIFAIEDVVHEQLGTLNGREMVEFTDLRADLRARISPEAHALCTARIVREIEEFTSMVG